MQEKSLRIYDTEKTFMSKVTNKLSKLLIPTRVGINGIVISMKRNSLIKAYENYNANLRNENEDKRAAATKKYEDAFTLYLEAIDKNIMDSVYKKVKNDIATGFEREALSKYYMVIHLKDNEYLEYSDIGTKYKQKIIQELLSFFKYLTKFSKEKVFMIYTKEVKKYRMKEFNWDNIPY